MRRVRAGQVYRFEPVLIDQLHPPYNVEPGDIVRVVNLPGCPRAGVMRHCHIEHLDGGFAGLVCCNSLQELTAAERQERARRCRRFRATWSRVTAR